MAFPFSSCIIIIFFIFFRRIACQQSYDGSPCSSHDFRPGSQYTCNSTSNSCHTFIVYRPQLGFQTISDIARLLNITDQNQLININNLTTATQILKPGTDVLVPINCSCSGEFFQANLTYAVLELTSYSEIACGVFEGLLKARTLLLANPNSRNAVNSGTELHVPLRCACPDNSTSSNGTNYLLTYPFIEGDGPCKLGKKFGIPQEEIWAANGFKTRPTVYPNTTFLVPLKGIPVINPHHSNSCRGQNTVFVPLIPVKITDPSSRKIKLYIIGAAAGVLFLFSVVIAGGFYIKCMKKMKNKKFEASGAKSTPISRLSLDLAMGSTLKYSLCNYSIGELREATNNFSEDTKISSSAYKGRIGDFEVIIKQMNSEDTHRIIDMYSKINHTNIVRLHGMCYGGDDCHQSHLVFEYAGKSCLRDCLLNASNVLQWQGRTKIAYDVAVGLHYLHYCSIPSYVHMNINSRNILITHDGRAKIANFGVASVLYSSNGKSDIAASVGGWIAPEYLLEGLVSAKVDIFAFGVVLFELISGKDALDGSLFKESLGFLGGCGSEGNCFQRLRSLMDPGLKEADYPLGDALCMAILAKACVEDEPLHRPSMNDILKILARMV
ncbi:protein LYK5-like [Magnolia sinica]|uniref:protein LYK5-like n=1 Tax=Magnolia sinica TaxID=86752 RepID=UPI00265B2740|nr:protein LYK5-like [Magnolia sinica]